MNQRHGPSLLVITDAETEDFDTPPSAALLRRWMPETGGTFLEGYQNSIICLRYGDCVGELRVLRGALPFTACVRAERS